MSATIKNNWQKNIDNRNGLHSCRVIAGKAMVAQFSATTYEKLEAAMRGIYEDRKEEGLPTKGAWYYYGKLGAKRDPKLDVFIDFKQFDKK